MHSDSGCSKLAEMCENCLAGQNLEVSRQGPLRRLYQLVDSVPAHRSKGVGFDSRGSQIFGELVLLEPDHSASCGSPRSYFNEKLGDHI
jgi:hypothetical protein